MKARKCAPIEPSVLRVKQGQQRSAREFLMKVESQSSSHYKSWLDRAKKFDEAGQVNVELCRQLVLSLSLLEVAEKARHYKFVRRTVELSIVLSFFATIGLPLFALLALAIKVESRGPVFFKQLRLGFLGQPFWVYKFRTMYEFAEAMANENVVPISKHYNDPRATYIGRILRRFKIDELPQLLNVIKGDMALIGPRPLSLDESLCVSTKYLARFAARPGLTGLWQAFLPFPKNPRCKLALDAIYARRQSLKLDLVILFRTIPVVLFGEPRDSLIQLTVAWVKKRLFR